MLVESIAQNIMLLITTKKAKTDMMKIMATMFGTPNSITEFRLQFGERRASLHRQILAYEQRLANPIVEAYVSFVEIPL